MSFEKIIKLKVISDDSELEDDEALEEFLVNFLNDEFYKDALTFERVIDEMTEKRFWLSPIVYDGEQRFVRDKSLIGEKSMSNNEVVDLLNELSEENEKLKKDCSNLIDDNTEYVAEINQMHKENEQLKADKQSLIDFIKKEFPKSHKHILEGFE